jgi:REP element-mobilizing transposase RayT
MSRPLRIEFPDAWYHVMNRGRKGDLIFKERGDYYAFIDLLKDCTEIWNMRVVAYCLMGTHYHILLQTPDANLSRCMRHIDGVYTQYFNRSHGLDGHLFRGRYKSILVDSDSYLLELLRYIHRNPVEAGIVKQLESYQWSSHKGYLSGSEKWNWLHKAYVLRIFSKNTKEALRRYRNFVNKEIPGEINRILGSKKWPSVLGKEGFKDWVRDTFFVQKRHVEVPESKSLAPDPGRIKEAVCRFYNINAKDLVVSRRGMTNEPRNIAIYLMRNLTGKKLEEIGGEFGINNYSSVSTIIERTKQKAATDGKFRKRIEKVRWY